MKKLKASIIEKIDRKQPSNGNFNQIKKKLTYTWAATKQHRLKPWHKLSFGMLGFCIIMLCIGTYFKGNFYTEPVITDSVKEMKLVSWDEDVYLLGDAIYVDYPMFTTKCNIEDKINFSDNYWEVYSNNNQIDKENIPLSFGMNTFTIYEKAVGDDKPLYKLNILVGRDIENYDINLVNSFNTIDSKALTEQVVSFNSFKQFEKLVIDNNLDNSLLLEYDEVFFENNSLLMVISKNSLNELTYQSINNKLNVTLIGDVSTSNNGYLIPMEDHNDITTYDVELFNFKLE